MQEEDEDVDSDKDSRDAKSRHVLRALQAGTIRYRRHGNLICPFCVRIIDNDRNSMIRHAVGVGNGSKVRVPHVKAKHATYGVLLKKLFARDIRLGLAHPPRRSNSNQDKKARKARKAWNKRQAAVM